MPEIVAAESISNRVLDVQVSWAELDLPPQIREALAATPLVQTPKNRT